MFHLCVSGSHSVVQVLLLLKIRELSSSALYHIILHLNGLYSDRNTEYLCFLKCARANRVM